MNPKIHLVTDASGAVHLVRSLTKAGARKHVERKLGQSLHVKLPSQDELLAAVQHTPVEDATQPANTQEGAE